METANFYIETYKSGKDLVVMIRNRGCKSSRYPADIETFTIGPRNAKKLDTTLDGLGFADACTKVRTVSKASDWREF